MAGPLGRRPKFMSFQKQMERSTRDGSPSVRMHFYPTKIEVARLRAMQKSLGSISLSELVTSAIEGFHYKSAVYHIWLEEELAAFAEQLAEHYGFRNADEWISKSIKDHLREELDMRDESAGKRRAKR